jgi:ABC-type multidrug transport system ATPase subunit
MSLLSGTNLSYRIGNLSILKGIDIEVKPGELVGLIGPNGAGKSTLLRLLTCVEQAHSGEISYEGRDVNELSAELPKNVPGVSATWYRVRKPTGQSRSKK